MAQAEAGIRVAEIRASQPSRILSPFGGSVTKGRLTRFVVLTTCHAAGWQLYGRRMVEPFDRFWPADVPLYLYAEQFEPDHLRPLVRPLPPWLDEFKSRHAANPRAHGLIEGGYNYRQDCVRFAHKVAAVTDAASMLEADVLIWADADIVTH